MPMPATYLPAWGTLPFAQVGCVKAALRQGGSDYAAIEKTTLDTVHLAPGQLGAQT